MPSLFRLSLVAAGSVLLTYSLSVLSSSLTNAKPDWVVSPERSGFISVVGYSPKQTRGGEEAQKRVALMKARQQLGQMARVRVENTYQQVQQVKNGGAASVTVDSTTRLSSSAALNLGIAEITAQWVDSANGDLYLLLELPEKVSGNH